MLISQEIWQNQLPWSKMINILYLESETFVSLFLCLLAIIIQRLTGFIILFNVKSQKLRLTFFIYQIFFTNPVFLLNPQFFL